MDESDRQQLIDELRIQRQREFFAKQAERARAEAEDEN